MSAAGEEAGTVRKMAQKKRSLKVFQNAVKWVVRGVVVRILRGPLKGKKWHLATRSRFYLGKFEPDQTSLFEQTVKEGDVVYDVGGHVGYYTLLGSMLVGDSGHVVCFEPAPVNLHYLCRHLALNACSNVTVMETCVADRSGECRFRTAGTVSGSIEEDGDLTTRMVSLDDLLAAGAIPEPDCIKMDIEGAEYMALQGAQSLIASARPTIFLSIHGDEVREECFEFLRAHNYELRSIGPEPLARAVEVLATPGN